jgi:agmatine deiminase
VIQVTVGVRSEDWVKARALLDPGVRVVEVTSNDSWIRDSGPTFVVKVGGWVGGKRACRHA